MCAEVSAFGRLAAAALAKQNKKTHQRGAHAAGAGSAPCPTCRPSRPRRSSRAARAGPLKRGRRLAHAGERAAAAGETPARRDGAMWMECCRRSSQKQAVTASAAPSCLFSSAQMGRPQSRCECVGTSVCACVRCCELAIVLSAAYARRSRPLYRRNARQRASLFIAKRGRCLSQTGAVTLFGGRRHLKKTPALNESVS